MREKSPLIEGVAEEKMPLGGGFMFAEVKPVDKMAGPKPLCLPLHPALSRGKCKSVLKSSI